MPTPRPLYQLPTLADAQRVYITEGEKAVDAVISLGLIATTSPHGSEAANSADWSPLAGKECVILPDNDRSGRRYADDVVAILTRLTPTPVVKVLELPDLPPKGDAYDFICELRDSREADDIRTEIETLVDQVQPKGRNLPEVAKVAGLQTICAASISPQRVEWLWPGRIPLGMMTQLQGDPKAGKSLLTIDVAARVSKGRSWPDGQAGADQAGDVLLFSAEDPASAVIVPRLIAAGADLERIQIVQGVVQPQADDVTHFNLAADVRRLEEHIRAQNTPPRLVVFDPLSAYLGGTKTHIDADVRSVLAPLTTLAGELGFALVTITHLRKSGGGQVRISRAGLHRVHGIGSDDVASVR